MRIRLNSVIVQDQQSALRFYTEVLGFKKKLDLPAGQYRWLTVVSREEPEGAELVLEPNAHPAAARYQEELFKAGIPLTAFEVSDIKAEHKRLKKQGVVFSTEPTDAGGARVAVLEDTCGNLIQIYQAS